MTTATYAASPTGCRCPSCRALAAYFATDAKYDDVPIPAARLVGPAAIVRKLDYCALGR